MMIGAEVEARLTWAGIMDALEAGHRLPRAQVRDVVLARGADTLLNRTAWIDGLGQLVKCATVFPSNAPDRPTVNGAVTLFSDATGELAAVLDFHLVTRWKTAGDSLLAARRLAPRKVERILLVGSGTVARSMHDAYRSLWPGAAFAVWSPRNAGRLGLPVADDLEAAVRGADIICTATMATAPLVRGEWLRPGQHLDLIGAYTPGMREVDDAAMARARVFVDSRETVLGHIGELIDPLASGAIGEGDVLADLYDDPALWHRRPGDITIAKNGGGAHLDLMTADWIMRETGRSERI